MNKRRASHYLTASLSDSPVSMPTPGNDGVPTNNSVLVVYSVNVLAVGGVADGAISAVIQDGGAVQQVAVAKTVLAGETDTLIASFPNGVPLFQGQLLSGSLNIGGRNPVPGNAGAGTNTLFISADAASSAVTVTIAYDWVPLSEIRN